jgi:hypothetical protein
MPEIGEARLDDLWKKVQARLKVGAVTDPLGLVSDAQKANRVYLQDDVMQEPVENTVWGRVVLVPVEPVFTIVEQGTKTRDVRVMTLLEMVSWHAQGYDTAAVQAVVQHAIFSRLDGWLPPLDRALAVQGMRLDRPAQAYPIRANDERLWYTSAEYVCRVAAKPVP